MKLEEMYQRFSQLSWPDRIEFIRQYRERRQHDILAVQEFDLDKQAKKTRSTKAREPKDPNAAPKKRGRKPKGDEIKVTPEQMSLLKQLGMFK